MTVLHAYQVLESQGWIISRPQSGYFVTQLDTTEAAGSAYSPVQLAETIDLNSFVYEVLQTGRDAAILPFASAFPDPVLFPQQQIIRALTSISRALKPGDAIHHLPPGNELLRKIVAKRYALQGMSISPDEIIITHGALEALNFSLQAVSEPGDWIVVENPCFYGALQAVERLNLKAVAIRRDAQHGIDLSELEKALIRWPIKACWLMSNQHNPLGTTLSTEIKQQLVKLLEQHRVTLIEDDAYSELYFDSHKPLPAKAFDETGSVLHCSSFSKNLIAGFRVGWVVAGKFTQNIQRLQLMSTLSVSAPMQLALVNYLQRYSYETHLRRLRRALQKRVMAARAALFRHLPALIRITQPTGGYFLWVELPVGINTTLLYYRLLPHNISIAPGAMFSSGQQYQHCFRFNASWEWGSEQERATEIMGQIVADMLNSPDC
ncbi:MAG: 2-aminoadipate transaminase [Candidatus Erwinia impunctatus]|nr:2-aminoadipate transaminase [Culicoides impunctatus]